MLVFIPLFDGKRCDTVGVFEKCEVVHRPKYYPLEMKQIPSLILVRWYVDSRFHARKTIIAAIIPKSFNEAVGAWKEVRKSYLLVLHAQNN
jgi:hypothetical protein